MAANVGGTPVASGGASTPAPKPATPLHTAPIVAHSARLSYTGPVFEKTAAGVVVPYQAPVAPGQLNGATGGSPVSLTAQAKPQLLVPGSTARFVNGLAAAPLAAPAAIQEIVWAGNQIIGLPYIFGGGHASFSSPGYDCSGTVSFALHGASLLSTPADSSEFMSWGSHGVGRWVSIFSNPGHAYMDVAGLRLDTSAADDPSNQQGPRWRPLRSANDGYTIRHPLGL
jgi:cell wall-associated NlpC family hydrolase